MAEKSHYPRKSVQHSRKHKGQAGAPPPDNSSPILTRGPQFAEPAPTPDPTQFTVTHGSDKEAYKILDSEAGSLKPRAFPLVADTPEPIVKLADSLGAQGGSIEAEIRKAGQIVFHSTGWPRLEIFPGGAGCPISPYLGRVLAQ